MTVIFERQKKTNHHDMVMRHRGYSNISDRLQQYADAEAELPPVREKMSGQREHANICACESPMWVIHTCIC
jgi:sulfur transfer protein SufE